MGKGQTSVAENIVWDAADLEDEERWQCLGGKGATLWLTGLSGSGKSTIAKGVEAALVRMGRYAFRLDGDNIRHGLNADLGFSADERQENIRRIGEVALLFAQSGAITLVSFISPYRADRDKVRARHQSQGMPFFEIHVATPLAACEARDPKGLYQKARAGEISGMTGIDAPYEVPNAPDLTLQADKDAIDSCQAQLLELLLRKQVLRDAQSVAPKPREGI